MRQGQQNRRGRGRNNNNNNNNSNNNNNRKSQNPLTRSFESTGPDVKVRGTPSHVAEKYISLARDALSSGDRVLAENYLQHAEHYNRIILTYREQQVSQGGEFQGGLPRAQTFNAQDPMDGDDFGDEDGDDTSGNVQPQIGAHGGQGDGQPQGGGMPQQRSFDSPQRYDNRPPRHDNRGEPRHNNQPRHDRDGNRFDRNDRGDRNDNRGYNRPDNRQDNRPDNRPDRADRPERIEREPREPREFRDDRGPQPFAEGQSGEGYNNGNGHRRRERFPSNMNPNAPVAAGDRQPPAFAAQPPMPAVAPAIAPVQAPPPPPMEAAEQPAFLRRPVRRPRREEVEAAPAPRTPVGDDQD